MADGNSMAQLKEFFSRDVRPVTMAEMTAFWRSLSEEDKAYFKAAPLS